MGGNPRRDGHFLGVRYRIGLSWWDDVVRISRILRIHGRTYAARDSDFYLIEGGCVWDFEVYRNLCECRRY